ncbi:MAG: hypothetical protein VXU47_06470, partial [Pseudomonadota bacterium]|nr:hypothetical protein [Pseudomonadota bacterium]
MRCQTVSQLPDDGVAVVVDIVEFRMLGHFNRVPLALWNVLLADTPAMPFTLSHTPADRQEELLVR